MLRAVYSALELNHSDALEANLVNEMGRNLGLTADDVTKLSEQWQSEGLINLHWGPKLSLTPKGRDKATDASPSGSVYIGSNAIVVTAPIGSNAAVGHHASTGPVKNRGWQLYWRPSGCASLSAPDRKSIESRGARDS